MVAPLLLSFVVGALVGFLLAPVLRKRLGFGILVEIPQPEITGTRCTSDGKLEITVSVPNSVENLTLANLYSFVYDTAPTGLNGPPPGAVRHDPATTIIHPLPSSGLVGPTDYVVVWAEYHAFNRRTYEYDTCPGSGSSGSSSMRGMTRLLSAAATEQLEAVPRVYRVSPGSPLAGAGGGPAADLVGALSREREALLEYAPDASTPVEPVWQARGGPGPVVRWSLGLFHGRGGLGAVLTVVAVVGGREAQFTWVTSDWRPHTANRLAPEADEPGVPALLVRPA